MEENALFYTFNGYTGGGIWRFLGKKCEEYVKKGGFAYKNGGKRAYPLDEKQKKCYYMDMENINETNKKIAKNLAFYRKEAGLTQAELAKRINYSDKSVSKWEQGNGVPDIYILMQLAKLYGVTLNDLVGEETPEQVIDKRRRNKGLHVLIMLLSSGIVWLVATCFFVLMELSLPTGKWWIAFVYAVMINAIVLIVYAGVWKYRLLNFFSVSTLIWTTITCLYLTVLLFSGYSGSLWLIFLLGVPLQLLAAFWGFFRSFFSKTKERFSLGRKKKTEIPQDKEKDEITQ